MSTASSPAIQTALDGIRQISPVLAQITETSIVDELWSRPQLSRRDRGLITLSAFISRHQTAPMANYLNKALDCGVTPDEVSELITQMAFYASWPNAFAAAAVAREVFAQRGVKTAHLPGLNSSLVAQGKPALPLFPSEQGLEDILPGLAHFTDELLHLRIARRGELAPRDRILVALGALIASAQTSCLAEHFKQAHSHGVTITEIAEIMTHLAFYSGWPVVLASAPVFREFARNQGA